jgi:hypothetical protein
MLPIPKEIAPNIKKRIEWIATNGRGYYKPEKNTAGLIEKGVDDSYFGLQVSLCQIGQNSMNSSGGFDFDYANSTLLRVMGVENARRIKNSEDFNDFYNTITANAVRRFANNRKGVNRLMDALKKGNL